MPKFKLHIYAEGEREGDEVFDTEAERIAYADGFSRGAGLYGGDGAMTYTPEELKEAKENGDL